MSIEKPYRGFLEEGKGYYIGDKQYEFNSVSDSKAEALQNKVLELDKKSKNLLTVSEVRQLTKEILETTLKGCNFKELQDVCNLSELQAIGSDLIIFLLVGSSKRELELLEKRFEAIEKQSGNTQT
jgi:hypothetical protein